MINYMLSSRSRHTMKKRDWSSDVCSSDLKETERMIRMVNDLLQLSKMDNKDYTLHTEKFDFMSYFHEVIDRFEMNKEKSIRLKRDLARGPLFVQFDKDKMTQVMDNLISNVIK